MRKKLQMLVCALAAAMVLSPVTAFADAAQTVTLSTDSTLIYENDGSSLSSAFEGMAPGDSRTVEITVKNENSESAAFYISGDTIKALEDSNASAKGGAYSYNLSVGKDASSARSLLDTVAGGYDASQNASDAGLSDVTELKDYQYLDKLNTGESTNIYLTLSLDGESFDSAYANAAGEIEFQFRAYYEDNNTTPVVVTEYKNEKGQTTYVRRTNNITTQSGTTSTGATTIADALVPLAAAVKTGDATPIAAVFVVFMAGVVLLILASRKKGAAGRDEK